MGAFTKDGIKRKQEAISWVIGELEKRKGEIAEIMRGKMTIRSDDMELLTTGQMIDKLKIGQVAKLEGTNTTNFVHRTSEGFFYGLRNSHKSYEPLTIIHDVPNYTRWRILPNYVSFEDAKKAFIDGKNVALRDPNGDILHLFELDSEVMIHFTFNDFIHGKWTIEED